MSTEKTIDELESRLARELEFYRSLDLDCAPEDYRESRKRIDLIRSEIKTVQMVAKKKGALECS